MNIKANEVDINLPVFQWCSQDEWKKDYKEKQNERFCYGKRKSWFNRIKNFKNSNRYRIGCPADQSNRPKTPDIGAINLDSKDNNKIFKVIKHW